MSCLNIRSEFSIKIRARPLVKIDHVFFIYVTTPHSESAVLAITHEKCALLQMTSTFAQVGEEEIPQIISDSIPTNTKRQTAWSVSIFKGKSETKPITSQRKVIDNCFEYSTGFSPTIVSNFL